MTIKLVVYPVPLVLHEVYILSQLSGPALDAILEEHVGCIDIQSLKIIMIFS